MGFKRKGEAVEDGNRQDVDVKKSKADQASACKAPRREDDEDGRGYWELSAKRRVAVTDFKGSKFLMIREYYEKDGKSLPGKSGINLNIEQLGSLILTLPDIIAEFASEGVDLPRVTVEQAEEDQDKHGKDTEGQEIDDEVKSMKS